MLLPLPKYKQLWTPSLKKENYFPFHVFGIATKWLYDLGVFLRRFIDRFRSSLLNAILNQSAEQIWAHVLYWCCLWIFHSFIASQHLLSRLLCQLNCDCPGHFNWPNLWTYVIIWTASCLSWVFLFLAKRRALEKSTVFEYCLHFPTYL